ncbi:MAG: hypothetical protein AAGC92_04995 [Pseudomonadota bacterium]
MRSLAVLVLSVLIARALLVPASAEPLSDPGWGLPADLAAERLRGRVLTVAPPRRYGADLQAPLLAGDVAFAGMDWRVWLQTGPDGRLRQLLFQPQLRQTPGFARLLARLRVLYGPETRLCQKPSGEAEAVWQLSSGVLHLSRWSESRRSRIGHPPARIGHPPASPPRSPTKVLPRAAPEARPLTRQVPREGPQIRTVPLAPERLPNRDRPGPRRLVEPGETVPPRPAPQIGFPPPAAIDAAPPGTRFMRPEPAFRRAAMPPPGRLVLRVHDPDRFELASRRCPPG